MAEQKQQYYMIKEKAVPEALLKVAQVNSLLNSGKAKSIKEAIDRIGISRSSYYKYKDDIFPIQEKIQGRTITFTMVMDDEPGVLSDILKIVADCKANVLSIHQSIPVNHMAIITLSIVILPITEDVTTLIAKMEKARGIHNLRMISAE